MQQTSYSQIDIAAYSKLMQFAGRLSRLFSDTPTPLIDYRFVEKAFVAVTKARDLSRKDISYDAAMHNSVGVGVKTFGFSANAGHKLEKIAEFTTDAKNGEFAGLPPEAIASVVSDLRNVRLRSDAAEFGVSLDGSFYHCLLRVAGGAMVHEEDMVPIDQEAITPISAQGKALSKFPLEMKDHVRFTDGIKEYTFNRSKNTLMQRFRLSAGFTSQKFDLSIQENIWELLLEGALDGFLNLDSDSPKPPPAESFGEVVLPLYSTQSSVLKTVASKSGINQWNAGGRQRSFGEAYIPIPRKVHDLKPGFFPPRDQKFDLHLPSGEVVTAKVCQDGSKALMSDPNTVLCSWLFSTIDGDYSYAETRLARHLPYTYDDLAKIGKDAVRVKRMDPEGTKFELEFAPVDSYEDFVAGAEDPDTE